MDISSLVGMATELHFNIRRIATNNSIVSCRDTKSQAGGHWHDIVIIMCLIQLLVSDLHTIISVSKVNLHVHSAVTLPYTVNSRYCGHSRDRDLVSVIARVRNNGVREKKS